MSREPYMQEAILCWDDSLLTAENFFDLFCFVAQIGLGGVFA